MAARGRRVESRIAITGIGMVGVLLVVGLVLLPGCSKKNSTQPPAGGSGGGPSFNSGNFTSGGFVQTYPDPGTFGYRCTVHGSSMTGAVEVDASNTQDSMLVAIGNNFFNPALAEIRPGGYVRWVAGGGTHGVRSN